MLKNNARMSAGGGGPRWPEDFSDRFPEAPGPSAPPPRKRTGLWVGIGCLGAFLTSCCLLTWWVVSYGPQYIANEGGELSAYGSQMFMAVGLQTASRSCEGGEATGQGLGWFPPEASSETKKLVCDLDRSTLEQLSDPQKTKGVVLSETDEAPLAESMGFDPAKCYRYTAEHWRVIGCFDLESKGQLPYKILAVSREASQEVTADENRP